MIGVIGGSGIYELFDGGRVEHVPTPWGEASGPVTLGQIDGTEFAFIARHGAQHQVPAHRVNYRANLWALREVGVDRIVAPCAVGSLREEIAPGEFVLLDQFLDLTSGRRSTFFDGPVLVHVSAADPYCADLRGRLGQTLASMEVSFHPSGTVVVVNGPRFSTRAESKWFATMGGDVVNMTQCPEAGLARELGLCYCGLALVTDRDVGSATDSEPVQMEKVFARLREMAGSVKQLMAAAATTLRTPGTCTCADLGAGPAGLAGLGR